MCCTLPYLTLQSAESDFLLGAGFLDVSKLLSGSAKVKTSYEKLAGMIGVRTVCSVLTRVQHSPLTSHTRMQAGTCTWT